MRSRLVVSCAELLEAVAECIDSFSSGADDHTEESVLEETLGGESQTVLLAKKLLAEIDIVRNALELREFDTHHHVHGSTASDRSYTFDGGEASEGGLGRGRKLCLHTIEMLFGNLRKDSRNCSLNHRNRMELDRGVILKSDQNIIEVALVVVDDGPTASPAWQAEDL